MSDADVAARGRVDVARLGLRAVGLPSPGSPGSSGIADLVDSAPTSRRQDLSGGFGLRDLGLERRRDEDVISHLVAITGCAWSRSASIRKRP